MAKAKNRTEWNQTSHVLAVLINANRDPKKSRAVTPHELNPYAEKSQRKEKPDYYISAKTFAKAMVKRAGNG